MKIVTLIKTMLGLAPNCEKVNQFLGDYMDGSLPENLRTQFEEHIAMCKCCKPYMDQYQRTIEWTHDCRCNELPEELVEHTISFLRKNADYPQS